jgi:hypothetical protein
MMHADEANPPLALNRVNEVSDHPTHDFKDVSDALSRQGIGYVV